jgi:hypothetical protein
MDILHESSDYRRIMATADYNDLRSEHDLVTDVDFRKLRHQHGFHAEAYVVAYIDIFVGIVSVRIEPKISAVTPKERPQGIHTQPSPDSEKDAIKQSKKFQQLTSPKKVDNASV